MHSRTGAAAAVLAAAAGWCGAAAGMPAAAQVVTPAGTHITNTAVVSYGGSAVIDAVSNSVHTVVAAPPTPSTLAILRAAQSGGEPSLSGPTACQATGGTMTLPPPVLIGGATIDPTQPALLAATVALHGGEPLFLRLEDRDQDRDAAIIDTIEVEVTTSAGDRERLRLSENAVDSGVFVGYVQTLVATAVTANCRLEVARNGEVAAYYVDPDDATDESAATARVDGWGLVFDSRTGLRIDGARVRLVNASTGLPAQVVGDDGVSAYPAELTTGATVTDAGGTAYSLPPGTYRFPIVAPGNYRVEVEPPPGYAFPSSLEATEIQEAPGGPYRLNAGSWARDYAVATPVEAATDLPLDAIATDLFVQKRASAAVAAIGDFLQYTITIENTSATDAVVRLRTVDVLPAGLRYRPGSARLEDTLLPDPEISADGRTLTFLTGLLAPAARAALRYVAEVAAGAQGRRLVNAAQTFGPDGSGSNVAHAIVELREELFRERAILLGRIVEGDCVTPITGQKGVAGVRVYLEDGRNATTDAEGKYHFDDVPPGSHVVQLDTITVPDVLEPLACRDRVRHAGSGISQFVDLRAGALWRADFRLAHKESTASQDAPAIAAAPAESATVASLPADAPAAATALPATLDLATLETGIGWVLPAEGDMPAIPAIKVAIRHLPLQRAELIVNGSPVHALNFDGVSVDPSERIALSRWRGIELRDGDNRLVAVVRGEDGNEIERLERRVHYAGGAVRAELVREASALVADGRTRPVIALRMTDTHGRAARPGTQGAFRVQAPYRSWWEVETLHENPLVAFGNREPIFSVGEDGLARLELEPTTQAGTAIVELRFDERHRQEIRVWLEPAARDWILVGIAEGGVAWNEIQDNLESAAAAGIEDGYAEDGRIAFFAKGVIKGEFLLTAAYDSARDREEARERLLGVVEPDRYYTLYGDVTEQRFEAASTEKLFLKLERRQFAALFGDYETGLTVTELSRYSRTMTGFKGDYAGDRVGVTVFAADTEQGFVKDEMQGDGTSGLYRLSRNPLIINSDKVRIEVRDRFRSEIVLESRPQSRYLDYDIDYVNGTLFFKRPVPSRDAEFNPLIIVADYEVLNGGRRELAAGGRAALHSADDRLELGASLLHEGAAQGDSQVAGLDFRFDIDPATELRAELAHGASDDPARPDDSLAYLAELSRVTGKLDARAYIREQESGFGVGQQAGAESGTRKFGADARWRIGQFLLVEGEAWRQNMLDSGAERDHASATLRYEAEDHALGVGLRRVADSGLANGGGESRLGFVSGRLDVLDDRVTLRASQDVALGGDDASVDYPVRSLLGLDYHWRPGSTLFAEYETASGRDLDTDMTRIGVRTTPWEQAQLQSSMTQEATEFGPRLFANLGLTQGWRLNDRWGFDAGVDQSNTIRGPDLEPLNPNAPLASGSLADDFTAVFAGAQYRSGSWSFTSRAETRNSDREDRRLFTVGFYREPVAGHAFSMAVQLIDSDFASGADTQAETIQLSWAYRPIDGAWILLDRLDLKHDVHGLALDRVESERIVNNLNANREIGARMQLGVQLGGRYVVSSFDDEEYRGFSGLFGMDLRRELNERFDVGLQGSSLHSLESGTSEISLGIDLGVTLARNFWVSVGYNFAGFRDEDFSASRYTAQGPFVWFRLKADQHSLRNLLP
jgi:uncharacterized repeat protein (TIGR01451 family)